ncbi:MAG: hypothetical protein V1818_04525 [Candidatus Aenigmatarchaeota archaeon]
MKGQMRIEFIAGILIFVIIIVFIVNQTNITFSNLLTDSRADILKAKALNSITILTEDVGNDRIGLATAPLELSMVKINNLDANCQLLEDFELGSYRLKIYNSTSMILFCGYEMSSPPRSIETRYVKIGNDYGNVTLELW